MLSDMRDFPYEFWLASIRGIGCKKISALLERFCTPEGIFHADEEDITQVGALRAADVRELAASRNKEHVWERYDALCRKGICFTWKGRENYPKRLLTIDSPPYGLFYRGSLPDEEMPAVAVVGARNASYRGCELARMFGRELAENGIAVISGLARGVDIASQKGVLSVAGGRTYGVLGCGIDQCYPRDHIDSYMLMQENGGVISEYCPGMPPLVGNFPMRNRIISGLAKGILVIEAGEKSGSLITAEYGMEQGKDVFVVPGDVGNSAYVGSNQLIKYGAALVTQTQDILDGLGIFLDEDVSRRKKKYEVMLETSEKIVYSYLGLEPIHISELVRMSGFSVQRTMELLIAMELKGLVKQISGQYYAIVL